MKFCFHCFLNCHFLLRFSCVSNLSAIFCNICSIFLSSFCPKVSLSHPSDSIFPLISYPPVLNFFFPFCPPSSSIMLFNKSTFSSRLCRNFRCFFVPLLPISDNLFLLYFTPEFPQLAMFQFVFSSAHYEWAHYPCVNVSVHSSGFSNIFRFLGERLAIVFKLIWCVVRYGVLADCSMTFRRLCTPRF
jgi:hypothetical protein